MKKRQFLLVILSLVILILAGYGTAAAAPPSQSVNGEGSLWALVAGSLAWLVPIGFVLLAAGGMEPDRAREAALTGLAAFGLAAVGYWAVGFGLHFGGIGLINDHPDLAELVWEWTALGPEWGPDWGMAGLSGWGLLNGAATPMAYALFFSQLPWVTVATLIPLLSLRGRTPAFVSAIAGLLVSALLYPLAGNWIWGGGWLGSLGRNLGLGHGLVDFGGAGGVHLLGAAMAFAGILAFALRRPAREDQEPVDLPPVHLPLLAALGAILIIVGNLGWIYANPLLDPAAFLPVRGALNGLLAAAGGALVPLAYTWFVAGRHDALMTARGVAAGTIAALGAGPFMPPWAALLVGAVTGLLALLVTYIVDHLLRLEDPTAVIATHGLGGVLGLLAVGVFADGSLGRGWNGIGEERYLGTIGQGVTGLLAAAGRQPDWPGQMEAQLIGLATLVLVPFLVGTIWFGVTAILARAWYAGAAAIESPEPDAFVMEAPLPSDADEPPTVIPDEPPHGHEIPTT